MDKNINYSTEKLQEDFTIRDHIREILCFLKKECQIVDKNVIELGSGLGDNLKLFRQDNVVTGYEGLSEAVLAMNKISINASVIDLNDFPYQIKSGSVDVVLCLDVLEHLTDPFECVNECYRILKEQGILVINVPNHFTLSGRVKILFGSGADSQGYFPQSRDWDNPHIRFFRHQSAVDILTKNGFVLFQDYSSKMVAFPGLGKIKMAAGSKVLQRIALIYPDLFSAGFFLVGKKI